MKENKKIIIGVIIGIVISSTISITATTLLKASSVSYDNTTVDVALDNLFDVVDLQEQINNIFDKMYPVGSVYISTSDTNPSNLFGGTWESYGTGRTLVGAGSNGTASYEAGYEGGNVSGTISLGVTNLPNHTHTTSSTATSSVNLTANTNGAHTHEFSTGGRALVLRSTTDTGSTYKNGFSNSDISWWNVTNKNEATIASAGAHTHTVTGSVTIPALTTSSCTNCNGEAFSTQDAYVVVYIWKRTK